MLVTRNRKVYLDHVDIDYIPITPGAARKTQSVKIEEWIDAGQQRSVDFEAIAKEATVRVFAHADKSTGYGNLDLSLIEARVIDNADSPYADAVASAKAIQRALDHNDVSSIRAMAQRMYGDLVAKLPSSQVAVEEKSGNTATGQPGNPELLNELQSIEDLLTGTEAERREGLDRLHQLVRKLRPQTH
jgi:hypothetical protein